MWFLVLLFLAGVVYLGFVSFIFAVAFAVSLIGCVIANKIINYFFPVDVNTSSLERLLITVAKIFVFIAIFGFFF